MDLQRFDTTIRIWIVVALLAGTDLIVLNRPLPTTIGVLLVIFGLLSVIAVVRNGMAEPATG